MKTDLQFAITIAAMVVGIWIGQAHRNVCERCKREMLDGIRK